MNNARVFGYTPLEATMLIVVVCTMLRLTFPNYIEIRERMADATAQRDFQKIKFALHSLPQEKRYREVIFVLNQDSSEALSTSALNLQLEDGVRVNYAIQIKFPGFFDLTALEVKHDRGKHLFRLLEINDKGMEQIIRQKA